MSFDKPASDNVRYRIFKPKWSRVRELFSILLKNPSGVLRRARVKASWVFQQKLFSWRYATRGNINGDRLLSSHVCKLARLQHSGQRMESASRQLFHIEHVITPRTEVDVQAVRLQLVAVSIVLRFSQQLLQTPALPRKIGEWQPDAALALIGRIIDHRQ